MFVYHSVNSNLRVEIIFRKEGTAENGLIDFEIGDIGTSAYWYWRFKKLSCRVCLVSSVHYWIILICLAAVQN